MSETIENYSAKGYFEPSKPPEEVVQSGGKKILRIRFKTREDVENFVAKTGINLVHGRTNKISYPSCLNSLDEFFV